MKKLLLIIPFFLVSVVAGAQKDWECSLTFDNPPYISCVQDTLIIDTAGNPDNIWQIGQPNKPVFDSAYSQPNAIVTLLDTCYPSSDTSSFKIIHIADYALANLGWMSLQLVYRINSDTLADFGTIEYSPDNGLTWINLITDTFYYQNYLYHFYPSRPILSGNNGDWHYLTIVINDTGFFHYNFGDTVLWRFTFITDSNQTSKPGWMIDNINILDVWEEVEEINTSRSILLSPNPTTHHIALQLPPQFGQADRILVYDRPGRLLMDMDYSPEVDVSSLAGGLYFVVVSNEDGERVTGRFVRE